MDMKRMVLPGLGQHAQAAYDINGQKWKVRHQARQKVSRIQSQHDHNAGVCDGVGEKMGLMLTLPLVDVMTLLNMGINAINPNDDEMKFIHQWARINRPHLIADKFKEKRRG